MDNKLKSILLELTNKCGLLCKHCSTEASPKGNNFLSLESVKSVLMDAKKIGADRLSLSGGEPLLHPEIISILKFASDLNFKINLYTSGVLMNKQSISEELIESLVPLIDILIFSLYAADEKIHDKITDIKDSFKITIQSLKLAKSKGVKVEIHTVPMSGNYNKIPDLLNMINSYDIKRVSLLRLVPHGRCLKNKELILNKKQSLELLNIVKKYEQKRKKPNIRKGAPFRYLFLEKANSCSAGYDKILINPSGDVYPCEAFKSYNTNSNINRKSLREMWQNDKKLNNIRELELSQIKNCKDCKKENVCEAGCHGQRWLFYNNISIGPDPACIQKEI